MPECGSRVYDLIGLMILFKPVFVILILYINLLVDYTNVIRRLSNNVTELVRICPKVIN